MSRRTRPLVFAVAAAVAAWVGWSPAQTPPAGKRYALLAGVNEYKHARLPALKYAENDAARMAKALRGKGYEVALLTGAAADPKLKPTKANIEARLKEVLAGKEPADLVLVGLAGHGLQFEGQPDAFFCPSDAVPFPDETASLVSLKGVYDQLDKSFAGMKVLLVDACRDDPTQARRSRGIDADTAPKPPSGVAALFSCKAGERAFEADSLKHGVFFHRVLKGLDGDAKDRKGRVTFTGLAAYVMAEVSEEVPTLIGGGAKQSPNLKADYSNEPVLVAGAASVPPGRPPGQEPVVVPPPAGNEFVSKTTGMKFVRIKAGTFTMGSPASEKDRSAEEAAHEVVLSKDFDLGVCEVTQKEWRAVMGSAPWRGQERVKEGDDYPATYVVWDDAVEYARKLGEMDGQTYRLPTEAEWEYACRAGSRARFGFGDDAAALPEHEWYDGNAASVGEEYGHRVGQKKRNAFGLFDMHGNVSEWCSDWHGEYPTGRVADPTGAATGSERVVRGGGWNVGAGRCRAASRFSLDPTVPAFYLGLRLVRVAPSP